MIFWAYSVNFFLSFGPLKIVGILNLSEYISISILAKDLKLSQLIEDDK